MKIDSIWEIKIRNLEHREKVLKSELAIEKQAHESTKADLATVREELEKIKEKVFMAHNDPHSCSMIIREIIREHKCDLRPCGGCNQLTMWLATEKQNHESTKAELAAAREELEYSKELADNLNLVIDDNQAKLTDILNLARIALSNTLDCGNHLCIFSGHKGGQRTNGSCSYLDKHRSGVLIAMQRMFQILQRITRMIKEGEAGENESIY